MFWTLGGSVYGTKIHIICVITSEVTLPKVDGEWWVLGGVICITYYGHMH